MPLENKKQLFIIVGAVAAGIVAVVLTSNYVKTSIQNQTAALAEQYDAKQKELVSQIQQRSDQQMSALAQELQRVKAEQASAMQKQMAALQQAQQEQARMRVPQAFSGKRPNQGSLALKVPQGKRAVTVTINSLAAVGGLINAGDFVDVIAQLRVPSKGSSSAPLGELNMKTVTAMIFQGLQVLAVNTNIVEQGSYEDQQASAFLKITFAVDPQEAGLLAFADKNGTLELALRSPDESNHPKVKASTWKTLADYVLKNQGTNIQNPDNGNEIKVEGVKTNIQIFRRGQEL
jgi:pilus assembly protein CpaB